MNKLIEQLKQEQERLISLGNNMTDFGNGKISQIGKDIELIEAFLNTKSNPSNVNEPAFPIIANMNAYKGLTKKEYVMVEMLKALLSNSNRQFSDSWGPITEAVKITEELMERM